MNNYAKGAWYISLYELPDEIRELKIVEEDIINCAAEMALTKRTHSGIQGKFNDYQEKLGRPGKAYTIVYYTGYENSALMC